LEASPVAPYVVDAEEVQVDQCVFGLAFRKTTADEVWNCVDPIVVHDRSADTDSAGALATSTFSKVPSVFFLNMSRYDGR